MIKYDAQNRVLTMSQTDLEHCGFNWDDFRGECFLSGLMNDEETKLAEGAFTIVVAMHKGLYAKCKCGEVSCINKEANP